MRRVLLATVAVALPTSAAHADSGCTSRACLERVARKACSQTDVLPCLRRAALHWRVSYPVLRAIAGCENKGQRDAVKLNPYAINGSPGNPTPVSTAKSTGVVQFMPGTYAGTPYAYRTIVVAGRRWSGIWSAKWNALAGAWLLRVKGTGPWVSSRSCWS